MSIWRNKSKRRGKGLNEPLKHESHKRPVTRRDFIAQGFLTGAATVVAPSILGALMYPRVANATLSPDILALKGPGFCNIQAGAGKIPFICFDLAGGANIAGSNVLVGQQGGQMDFLSTAGYSKLGLPGNMVPNASVAGNFIDTQLGLAFHTDSAFLRGMMTRIQPSTAARINGAVIAARSENDTGNNPHNPMYGIAKAGARGELLTLIGSRSSDSGGNSAAPAMMMDPTIRPTKIDRTSDTTGLVDTGELASLLPQADTVAVMESMERISAAKLGVTDTKLVVPGEDARVKKLVQCGYVKTADLTDNFGNPSALNPELDPDIKGAAGIFSAAEFDSDGEFEKTAAVMKLVVSGYAGAGTVEMGGFDYHTGDRMTGEARDFRAGVCMGACLEYAARRNVPLMLYVFSDGSLSSNGTIDNSTGGRGKGVWTGDNQATAAAFFLVFNPSGRPALFSGDSVPAARHQQIGYYRASGDIETASSPAGNAVNLLVETVLLNYMALHGEQANFSTQFPGNGLGSATLRDSLTAFNPIVNGVIA
ncbi:MAG TPA: hypothetical protein VE046_09910 [Steroidobacteraceae bacterium]|nr:hypothetical protein [Steroidobacteraceae bacterium]